MVLRDRTSMNFGFRSKLHLSFESQSIVLLFESTVMLLNDEQFWKKTMHPQDAITTIVPNILLFDKLKFIHPPKRNNRINETFANHNSRSQIGSTGEGKANYHYKIPNDFNKSDFIIK